MRRSAAVLVREHLLAERAAEVRQSSGQSAPHCYASEAMVCARAIGFRIVKTVPDQAIDMDGQVMTAVDNGLDVRTAVTFKIGDDVHLFVKAALKREYPDLQPEVTWALPGVSGRSDGTYSLATERVLLEVKSTSNRSIGGVLKAGQPHDHHFVQACLGALALGCSLVHVIYVNKTPFENDSAIVDFLLPMNPIKARAELKRMQGIVRTVAAGNLPLPMTAAGKFITDPLSDGECVYCPHKLQCAGIGPRAASLTNVIRWDA